MCCFIEKRYIDRFGTDVQFGMIIRCTINGELVEVSSDKETGFLGILGAILDGLEPTVHPLWNFDGVNTPDGYKLTDFEIVR